MSSWTNHGYLQLAGGVKLRILLHSQSDHRRSSINMKQRWQKVATDSTMTVHERTEKITTKQMRQFKGEQLDWPQDSHPASAKGCAKGQVGCLSPRRCMESCPVQNVEGRQMQHLEPQTPRVLDAVNASLQPTTRSLQDHQMFPKRMFPNKLFPSPKIK